MTEHRGRRLNAVLDWLSAGARALVVPEKPVRLRAAGRALAWAWGKPLAEMDAAALEALVFLAAERRRIVATWTAESFVTRTLASAVVQGVGAKVTEKAISR